MKMITLEQAQQTAAVEIERLRNTPRLSRYEFSPVTVIRDEGPAWTFASGSRQLQDEGWAPGALFATIDKYDGHIWTDDEVTLYYQSLAAARQSELASVS